MVASRRLYPGGAAAARGGSDRICSPRHTSGTLNPARWIPLAFLFLPGACTGSADQQAPMVVADSLVGTWRVIAHLPPSGNDALPSNALEGYLVYDQTGHVFVQVMRRGAADSLTARRWFNMPDSILKSIVGSFRAYFGTYQVDDAARMVTHRIEGEFLPRRGQAEVATPFAIRGDTLTLGTDSSERWIFVRVR